MSLTPDEARKYPALAKIVEGLPEERYFSAITDEMLRIIREMNQSMRESNRKASENKFNYVNTKNNTK